MSGPQRGVLGLIPARAGSQRVPNKNVRPLCGHPLIAYTISAALSSGVFESVIVSTDSDYVAEIARHYGAEVPFLRPAAFAGALSPDIEWVRHLLGKLDEVDRSCEMFAILRPTSPLRTAATIQRAYGELSADPDADSLRAVELCQQHPAKMWLLEESSRMRPLLDDGGADPPWHSRPYQALPVVYVQNASLEMARFRSFVETDSIAGRVIRPFMCDGHEGFDINTAADWRMLEQLLAAGEAELPSVPTAPFPLAGLA